MLDTTVSIPTRTLVLGMARADGTIVASELYPVAEACGLTDDQVRSCLRRLVAEDLFSREGDGRETVFSATPTGLTALRTVRDRHRLAYSQDAAGKGWDRRWRLVAFAIPETKRAGRDAFRDLLRELGGAAVQSGLYVSPHPWHENVLDAAERLDVADGIVTATTDDLVVGGERDPRQIAARLWDLGPVADRYRSFIERYRDVPGFLDSFRKEKKRLTDADFLPGALSAMLDFQECFNADPLLPPELLPRPWPGREAREILATSRRLGILARAEHDQPRLFSYFDESVDVTG